ncbi:MAG: 50S ribosomal protein L25 [Bacteroidota bacterium]
MQTVALEGGERTALGKKGTKEVRKQGLIPCVMYGGDEVYHFTTTANAVKSLIYTPDFKLAEVSLGDATHKCIVKEVQYHPLTDAILHIDFLKLEDGRPVKVELPIRFYGDSPGMKVGGKLLQNLRRIKIKTTPENLVDELKVNIGGLELGQAVRVKDVDVTEDMEVMVDLATPVAVVEVPRALRSATAAAEKEGEAAAETVDAEE